VRAAAPALLAVLTLSACGSGGSTAPSTSRAKKAPVRAATKGSPASLRALAIFRRPATPHDQIPTDETVGGVRPGLSRLAYSGPLGMLFAYSNGGMLCVSFETRISISAGAGTGRCDSLATTRTAGVVLTVTGTSDHIDRLAMILPDGVRSVTVTRAGGRPLTLPVRTNAVVCGTPGLRGWSFTTPAGGRQAGMVVTAAPRRSP
jgi:hypothetical protein